MYGSYGSGGLGFLTIILFLISLASLFVPPVVCAIQANNKGRNVGAWVAIGLLLGWIGMIIILCLPSLNVKKPAAVYHPPKNQPFYNQSSETNNNVVKKADKYRCEICHELIDTAQCPWCGHRNGSTK